MLIQIFKIQKEKLMASEILSKLLLEYDQKKRIAEINSQKRKDDLYNKR